MILFNSFWVTNSGIWHAAVGIQPKVFHDLVDVNKCLFSRTIDKNTGHLHLSLSIRFNWIDYIKHQYSFHDTELLLCDKAKLFYLQYIENVMCSWTETGLVYLFFDNLCFVAIYYHHLSASGGLSVSRIIKKITGPISMKTGRRMGGGGGWWSGQGMGLKSCFQFRELLPLQNQCVYGN